MLRTMIFIDFENFQINVNKYYSGLKDDDDLPLKSPKLDYNVFPQKLVEKIGSQHILVKTFMFAPKPDEFLIKNKARESTYNWLNGMRNMDRFALIEGSHCARPVSGFTFDTMDITNPASYYVVEKGTDVNIAAHLITKGFMNAFDTAVLISGDTDYLPVLDLLNTLGKSVVMVGVHGQNLMKFKHHSDQQVILDKTFFDECLRS